MPITGVDHVVVRVKDLDAGIKDYQSFGLELERTAETPGIGKQAFFPLADGGFIELVAPTDPNSAVGKAIEGRGEGIHTIAVAVEDMEKTVEALKASGARLIGAENPGGQVFIHPKSAHGVLVQLTAKK